MHGMMEVETRDDVKHCGRSQHAENKRALWGHILLTWTRLPEKQFNHSLHNSATGKRFTRKRQKQDPAVCEVEDEFRHVQSSYSVHLFHSNGKQSSGNGAGYPQKCGLWASFFISSVSFFKHFY